MNITIPLLGNEKVETIYVVKREGRYGYYLVNVETTENWWSEDFETKGNEDLQERVFEYQSKIDELHLRNKMFAKEVINLKKDNTKLRTKVEANIPVERIEGLDDKLKNSIQVGTDGELYVEGKKISNIGTFIKEPTVSIEDHEALKKQVEENMTNHLKLYRELEEKVEELSKRPYVISIEKSITPDYIEVLRSNGTLLLVPVQL